MNTKRPSDESAGGELKRVKLEDKEEKARRARERIAALKAKKLLHERGQQASQVDGNGGAQSKGVVKEKEPAKGLDVELHPLLTGDEKWKTDNPNLRKFNKRGYAVNPYLSDTKPERKRREFKFNKGGKYIALGDEVRKQLALERAEQAVIEEKRSQGLLPDESLQEQKYAIPEQPLCEWWDTPFTEDYRELNEASISMYIQHPVPIMAPWESHLPPPKPLFLTKKEMKRIRRQARAEKYEEEQNKIKLGLAPPPPPKVKLNNLMNALTNEAIKDPTAVEQRVRREVQEREAKHIADNQSRKLSKEQRIEKKEEKIERDLQLGVYSAVFVIDKLEHPSHRFKVERNATQSRFVGSLLYCPEFVLVIVEGTEKNIRHYKRLMMNRIKWDESTSVDGHDMSLAGNQCQLVWEGPLNEPHFKKWTVFRSDSEQGAMNYLEHFGVIQYFKEAIVKTQATQQARAK